MGRSNWADEGAGKFRIQVGSGRSGMFTSFIRRLRKHWRSRRSLRKRYASATRFFRPLLEGLESRELLAFNLTISLEETSNVSTLAGSGITTFTATGNGANLNVADIGAALDGSNVVVSSGSGGSQ